MPKGGGAGGDSALTNFSDPSYSLAINDGEGGHRLTHSHTRHYHYVLQSLTLWREVC